MKISKLFHWLYAVVMLLPVFAIGVTCGYAMFNKNAYQSYAGENINSKTYIDLDNINELETNKNYYFNSTLFNNLGEVSQGAYARTMLLENISVIYNNTTFNDFDNYVALGLYVTAGGELSLRFFTETSNETITMGTYQSLEFTFTYISNNFNVNFAKYGIFKEIQYNNLSFVSEVFYYSVDKVTQSSLFSWAYDSFLVTPFAYIVNLFSMPINSPVVMLLSYWLTISVIWLVFDLIMYVPLLVHRWLDKGVLE